MTYHINDNGEIIRPNDNAIQNKWKALFWILFLFALIVFFVVWDNTSKYKNKYNAILYSKEKLENEKSKVENENKIIKENLDNCLNLKSKVESQIPILITDIDFRNGKNSNNFSTYFYKSDITYIYPRIKFTPLISEDQQIELFVKFFKPNGSMAKWKESPYGYTYSNKISISNNSSYILSGWGSSLGGSYSSGTYKVQVWYKNKILFEKRFTVY